MDLKKMNKTDIFIGALIFAVSFPFLIMMPQFVSGGASSVTSPLSFPRFVISIVVALSLVLVITSYFWPKKHEKERLSATEARHRNIYIPLYIAILFLYLVLLHYVGFLISTPVIMLMVAFLLQGRNFITLTVGSIIFTVGLYYVALKLMKIMLPGGVFFE